MRAYLLVVAATVWIASPAICQTQGKTGPVQTSQGSFHRAVPRVWDDQAITTLEVPLANPSGSPQHISADYYYRIPVRPIYKSYPVYAPGHEPPGYMDYLKRQDPEILWDVDSHRPRLQTEADWVHAGEMVFDSAIRYNVHSTPARVRQAGWYQEIGVPVGKDGVMPFERYVIRRKGEVELSSNSCATCHTRVMPDGSALKGAQGNLPFDRALAYKYRLDVATAEEHAQALGRVRLNERHLYAVPWLRPDPLANLDSMPVDDIAAHHDAIPPGVIARHRTSALFPVQVPDLIGVKDRHYLDRTGLQQHRGLVDLMRYAALNQGADDLASYGGFIPSDRPNFNRQHDPTEPRVGGRYSDEQLYALALYIYSLQPPRNPNRFDRVAARGRNVFEHAGCATCHPPPLYTNNKLTLADGFAPQSDALKKYDIQPISVGTDPNLTMKTRRGTGYYKVPSLKGVWYRGMFGHSGWCATLEDWFDPSRVREGYVPTGFRPYGVKTYAVKGHPFGLDLSEPDRKALIAFLKTL